jgi:hypothetical protein
VNVVSINVWRLAGDSLNISCNFLCCNHQVHRDFLITLYIRCKAVRPVKSAQLYTVLQTDTQAGDISYSNFRMSEGDVSRHCQTKHFCACPFPAHVSLQNARNSALSSWIASGSSSAGLTLIPDQFVTFCLPTRLTLPVKEPNNT